MLVGIERSIVARLEAGRWIKRCIQKSQHGGSCGGQTGVGMEELEQFGELVNLPLQGDQGKKLFQPDVSVGRNRIPWKNPEQIFFSVEPDAKFAEVRGETPVNLKSQ